MKDLSREMNVILEKHHPQVEGHVVEVERKDISKPYGFALMSNEHAASAMLSLSKEDKVEYNNMKVRLSISDYNDRKTRQNLQRVERKDVKQEKGSKGWTSEDRSKGWDRDEKGKGKNRWKEGWGKDAGWGKESWGRGEAWGKDARKGREERDKGTRGGYKGK